MKLKHFFLSALVSLLALNQSKAQGTFTFSPAKPKPGESITITYQPAAVVPAELGGYQFKEIQSGTVKGITRAELEFTPVRKAGKYTATFKTDTAAVFAYFVIKASGAADSNNGNGYWIKLYNGDKPRQNAGVSLSYFYRAYGDEAGVKSDNEKALAALSEEIALHPENYNGRFAYLSTFASIDKEKGPARIQEEIDFIKTKGLRTEGDYNYLNSVYGMAKQTEQSKTLTEEKKAKFPNGLWVAQDEVAKFQKEKDTEAKKQLYYEIVKNIQSKDNWAPLKSQIPNYQSILLNSYVAAKDWAGLKNALAEVKLEDKSRLASLHNSAAWKMYEDSSNLALAEEFANLATTYTKSEWLKAEAAKKSESKIKSLKSIHAMYADTYGAVLYKAGKYKAGYPIARESALTISEGKDADQNTTYALLASKVVPAAQLKADLEKFVTSGKSSSTIKNLLKAAYISDTKSESGFDDYLAQLEVSAKKQLREELAKKIENTPAPAFALVNLDGTEVKLADLKGKVVIVDFWATWCGPCIASFPAMKKAQEKYKNDPNVKFVFINTWETSLPDVKKGVTEFIEKGAYPFDVLFDLNSKVVASFGVTGIPTKFIIGKTGNIRFTSVGFSGSDDKLVDELSIMIELASSGE